MHDISKDPINNIVWRDARELRANHYNPNMVMDPELDLIEFSLLKQGWIQPLLVRAQEDWIIDGFHRWRISQDRPRVVARYKYMVPTAPLNITAAEAMMLTVRINRAKGTHAAVRMSDLVKALIDQHHCDRQEVATGIGATLAEVDVLYQESIFDKKRIKDYTYSQAWTPAEEAAYTHNSKLGKR